MIIFKDPCLDFGGILQFYPPFSRNFHFFSINQTTGEVFVSDELDRTVAASVTITISLTDKSAEPPQVGLGNLVITIVDVNDFPPAFIEPWTPQRPFLSIEIPEEQPKGTIVHTFRATDADSNIDRYISVANSQCGNFRNFT